MRVYITGIGGLIGSATAELALARGHAVVGVDSDARGRWFGHEGSVAWRVRELQAAGARIAREDFTDRLERLAGADLVVHCASQPSHDYSRAHVVQDSAVNYMSTVRLLEAVRTHAPAAVLVFLSTNKVYGDRVNDLDYGVVRGAYVYRDSVAGIDSVFGVTEDFPIDASLHTPFGVSKLAADMMVQEYRRTFGLRTYTLRCGCLTGTSGSAVELQGFLGYLVKRAVADEPYVVYGHEGNQVRDNLDASDLAEAILLLADAPDSGDAVYNMGGGRENALSVNQAIDYLRGPLHRLWPDPSRITYGPARLGDHKYWVTDYRKFERQFGWRPRNRVYEVLDAMVECERRRREPATRDATLPASAVA